MVLVFLKGLRPEFFKARPSVIGSSTVKSLENTYHLREAISSESLNPIIVRPRIVLLLRSKEEQHEIKAVGVT